MLSKIFRVTGILLVITALVGAFYFTNVVKENSEYLGYSILVANQDIKQGTVVKDAADAQKLFIAKRIKRSDLVTNAIRVDTVEAANPNFLQIIKSKFVPPNVETITPSTLNALVNRVIVFNVRQNQQIVGEYLSKTGNDSDMGKDEKEFAIPIDYLESVGGEVQKGDLVDVWINYSDKSIDKPGKSEKIIGPLRIIKIKDGSNEEILPGDKRIPKLAILWLKDQNIELLRNKQREGIFFLTKLKE